MIVNSFVSDECEGACSGMTAFYTDFVGAMPESSFQRRLQGGFSEGSLGALFCPYANAISCATGAAECTTGPMANSTRGLAMLSSFCDRDTAMDMLNDGLPDCEAVCGTVFPLMVDTNIIMMDAPTSHLWGRRLSQGRAFVPRAFRSTIRNAFHSSFRKLQAPTEMPGWMLRVRARVMDELCPHFESATCAVEGGRGEQECDMSSLLNGDAEEEEEEDDADDDNDPLDIMNMLPLCDQSLAVTVSMSLTVADPAAFAANPASKTAVEAGIAAELDVDPEVVNAVLTVPTRRLGEEFPRRLQSAVDVDATIHVEDEDAATTLQRSAGAMEPATMAASLNEALEEAGLATVEVANMASVTAPPQRTAAPHSTSPTAAPHSTSPSPAPTARQFEASAALKSTASIASGVFAVITATM